MKSPNLLEERQGLIRLGMLTGYLLEMCVSVAEDLFDEPVELAVHVLT